jgi:hypothetical protein
MCLLNNSKELEGQVRTVVIQSFSESCDGEPLAGGASTENVNRVCSDMVHKPLCRKISQIRDFRVVMLEHGLWELLDL